MKAALELFALSILCLAVSACGQMNQPQTAHIEVHQKYTRCNQPSKARFYHLPENGAHIGSAEVADKLTRNLVEWQLYTNSTDGALECYEDQSAKKE